MTPAIRLLKSVGVNFQLHSFSHQTAADQNYGDEVVNKLKVSENRVFKTLICNKGEQFIVAVIPVGSRLNLKKLAQIAKFKKTSLTEHHNVERITGYVLGGCSPLAQKTELMTYVDNSCLNFTSIFVSGGKRGLEIELSPRDLVSLTNAEYGVLV